MKLNFPDRDLTLCMEGGYCVYRQGGVECFCRLDSVSDDRCGEMTDIETNIRFEVEDVFNENIDWSWPPLGLRNVGAAAVCVSRTPAPQYRRTIKQSNVALQAITPQGTAYIDRQLTPLFTNAAISELFRPTYPNSLGHVKWAVSTGKAVSVALSLYLAVTAVDDDAVDDMVLFFKTIPVGTIDGVTFELTLNDEARDSKVGKRANKLYQEWRLSNVQEETARNAGCIS